MHRARLLGSSFALTLFVFTVGAVGVLGGTSCGGATVSSTGAAAGDAASASDVAPSDDASSSHDAAAQRDAPTAGDAGPGDAATVDSEASVVSQPGEGGPTVVTQIPAGAFGYALAVGVDDLYFATPDTLYSCPKTGCATPTTLVTGLASPNAIAYDAVTDRIYVANTNADSMNAYTTSGAVVFQDVVQYAHPTALTMDSTYLYWGIPGGVLRTTRDGQSTLQIVNGIPGQITWLTVDAASSRLYGGMTGNTAFVFTAPIDGSASWTAFAGTDTTPQPYPMQVRLQGGQVYWIDYGVSPQETDGGLYECPSVGCASPQAIPGTSLSYGSCFFIDSASISYVADGYLLRCPLAGCPAGPKIVASGILPGAAQACGEDATSYYFLPDEGPPNLLRVPK